MMHLVKFQFYILYINFGSEQISVQLDGVCFSTVDSIACMNTATQLIVSACCILFSLQQLFSSSPGTLEKISHYILDH